MLFIRNVRLFDAYKKNLGPFKNKGSVTFMGMAKALSPSIVTALTSFMQRKSPLC